MHFDLTEDQKEIRAVARELLAARSPWPRVRAAAESGERDEALWSELLELGWPGIAIGESWGGGGLGMVELAVLVEELGYACAVSPFFGSAVAGAVISAAGSDAQRDRLLPALAAGEISAGVGSSELCIDGEGAAVIVVLDGDRALLVEGAAAAAEPLATIDPTRRYASLGVSAWVTEPLGAGAADLVRAALAAELVGVCQRALEMTVEYVKERKQFGVAVGSFQAVAHRCAEMLFETESARSTALYAAWAADADGERLPEAAALAAAAAARAGREVTASAIQAHGGIGFTWEADVHWLFKRAQLDSVLLGGTKRHHLKLAELASSQTRKGEPLMDKPDNAGAVA